MKKIYYEKCGRKYVPISVYDSELTNSFTVGDHLIHIEPGLRSYVKLIDPAFAPMIAAGRYARDKMAKAIHEASEVRPKTKMVTTEEQEAWDKLREIMGDDRWYLQYPSPIEIVDAGLKAMQEEADRRLTNPAVKKAYEQFLMIYELAKDTNNN